MPTIGSRSLSRSLNFGSLTQTFMRELELTNQARAADERGDAPLDAVVRRAFRQRRPVGAAAADHPPAIHVLGGVARVHAPDVRAERDSVAVRVHSLRS